MGAMENKGLIIFNELSLLCDGATTTDARRQVIRTTVVHEVCHNWAGNRVTVNKWLELALKEGLATYLEHTFSKDTIGYAAYRITEEVQDLKGRQFAEDAGPTRHAVRPDEVESIDNIYTSTIYTKGAELLSMLSNMLGRKTFTEGLKWYFKKFDGQAVTIEDFIGAIEEVSARNLQQFLLWYKTPGTPIIEIDDEYDPEQQVYKLHVKQTRVNTAGDSIPVMHFPITFNLLDSTGHEILPETEILEVMTEHETFIYRWGSRASDTIVFARLLRAC